MRTLRELLLARHRPVQPRLDTVRREVLASLLHPKATDPRPVPRRQWDWRAVILSMRWHLAGLSAAWGLVLVLNLRATSLEHPVRTGASPQQVALAVRENRRQLRELLASELPGPAATAISGRRSQRQVPLAMV